MNVGFVGLGKLGGPVAYCLAARGLDVYGFDPVVQGPPADTSHEQGFDEVIQQAEERMRFCMLDTVVENCDTIFLAVQTPHSPQFEGVTPLPDDRVDFDYSYLKLAVAAIADAAFHQDRRVTVAVISTVLPGTMEREIVPMLGDYVSLRYSPSFIAMGTTVRDFLDPEFVLIGGDDDRAVEGVYRECVGDANVVHTSVRNAELIKVAYNTFIGLKIAFANTVMEVCHKTGCDVDEVTGALKQAHRRLISPAYLDGGMGDGGGCHPRDNIALSWLAGELNLSHDLFDDVMRCREDQAAWLADLMTEQVSIHDLPFGILGTAYKPGSHIETGSPALLVKNLLEASEHDVVTFDPHVDPEDWPFLQVPHVWLVGCKHPEFADFQFPAGSIVIDPFRYIPDQPGVEVVRVGEGQGVRATTQRHALPAVADRT